MPVGFDDLVDDVMSGAPGTIRVFLQFRMGCVGCPIACFHTVDDACREHGVDRNAFLDALRPSSPRLRPDRRLALARDGLGQHE
jgi:hybrid cluster-associated redox disulfide protein